MLQTWQISLIVAASSLFGTLVGAGIAYLTNRQRLHVEARRHWNDEVVRGVLEIIKLTDEFERQAAESARDPSNTPKLSEIAERYSIQTRAEMTRLTFITPQTIVDALSGMMTAAVAVRTDVELERLGQTADSTRVEKSYALYTERRDELRRQVKAYIGIKDSSGTRRSSRMMLEPLNHMAGSLAQSQTKGS